MKSANEVDEQFRRNQRHAVAGTVSPFVQRAVGDKLSSGQAKALRAQRSGGADEEDDE